MHLQPKRLLIAESSSATTGSRRNTPPQPEVGLKAKADACRGVTIPRGDAVRERAFFAEESRFSPNPRPICVRATRTRENVTPDSRPGQASPSLAHGQSKGVVLRQNRSRAKRLPPLVETARPAGARFPPQELLPQLRRDRAAAPLCATFSVCRRRLPSRHLVPACSGQARRPDGASQPAQ
jgi:hypothetical protein